MKYLSLLAFVALTAHAQMVFDPFTPVYKGIDLARGTNYGGAIPRLQVVRCMRVDLTDPDVQLFTTPPATNGVAETLSLTVSNMLKRQGLAIACNGNSYSPGTPSAEGQNCQANGLLVCTGRVVSAADNGDLATWMFTTNKEASFALTNYAPGVSTTGIFTAVTGMYPLLTNGICVWTNSAWSNTLQAIYTPNDSSIHTTQPRTALGLSQDRRYLFVITIDGRQGQTGYSVGAYDGDTAAWLLAFGAWDALNMDGGGSTAMYMADACGNPVAVNHSSFTATVNPPHERYIGAHFGVFAQPLSAFIYGVNGAGGSTTAAITWSTSSNATTQVEYGLTMSLGTFSPIDINPVTSHTVTVTGLTPARQYYFRVWSTNESGVYVSPCISSLSTTNPGGYVIAYTLTNDWKWQTENLDGITWQATNYNDSAWNHGPGTLWVDSRGGVQVGIPSPTTQLPLNPINGYPFTNYYFRTHFNYPGNPSGAILTFTNYVDDGIAVYLNGVEISRLLIPSPAFYTTPASGAFCGTGNATCPYVVTVSGDLTTNLHTGDNVIAVEVHNVIGANNPSPDITFGQSLSFPAPVASVGAIITNVVVIPGESNAIITWETLAAGNSQVQYGLSSSLGSSTPVNSALVTNHSVTLSNLSGLSSYFFRVLSSDGGAPYTQDGTFTTVRYYQPVLPLAATWRYTTNNLTASNWTAAAYNDSAWAQGNGLLYVEDNTSVTPRTTALPTDGSGHVFPTYYFRSHFTITNSLVGYGLLLTNFVDDGAVFYLNGQEIQRIRMPAGAVGYSTLASMCALDGCDATAEVPDIFRIGGDALTNVVIGDNVLAVEVHQVGSNEGDVVFGSSIGISRAIAAESKLKVSLSNLVLRVSWDSSVLTLQQALSFRATNTSWIDVIKVSPYVLPNPSAESRFFRLKD